MAKVRVHELAKELGKTSKELLAELRADGEFVKAASSTVEPPVARAMREKYAKQAAEIAAQKAKEAEAKSGAGESKDDAKSGAKTAPKAAKAPSKGTKAAKPGAPKPAPAAKPSPKPGPAKASPEEAAPADGSPAAGSAAAGAEGAPEFSAASDAPTSDGSVAASTKPASAARPGPRPGPAPSPAAVAGRAEAKPGRSSRDVPRDGRGRPVKPGPRSQRSDRPRDSRDSRPRGGSGQPRPGNSPFAPAQGMPRPQRRDGGPRPGNSPYAPAQGMPRPGGSGGPRPGPRPGGGSTARPGPRAGGRGGARPSPAMMPDRTSVGAQPSGGGRDNRGRGRRSGGGVGASAGVGAGRPGGFSGRGGRGGRGGTQGAFGRGGGRPARGRKSKRAKRQEFEQQTAPSLGGVIVPRGDGSTKVRVRAGSSLADLAEKIGANPAALVTVLMHLGEMATATQSLDADTFQALGAELGYDVQIVSPEDEDKEILESFDIDLEAEAAEEDPEDMQPRPPVVTVMGHVDHGKTKLLDAIRSTDVVAGEAGGITQHIGAYQVRVQHEGVDRAITFIDTPGHEAFTAMRARGAEVTDIAILVVAADDGVMPQTIEALNHAQAAGVPIVVAVNKMDKPEANADKIKAQLAEYGLLAEDYSGDTMFVPVSAKQRENIGELLEAVLLTADAALELEANPDKDARGVAIEAKLDKGRGAVITALVQTGTLRVGDALVVGTAYGRVRAMFDEKGNPVDEAEPSRPVAVLGLQSVPRAGDSFLVAPDDRTARQIADKRSAAERAATLAKRRKRVSLEDLNEALKKGDIETLNIIIKGDVSGAVEALEDSLLKIDVGEEVELNIIHRGVGAITQNDVNLATVDGAVIIGFNVRPAERVAELADREGVDIHYYSVIYDAIDDVEKALKGMLKPEFEEVELGKAEIRQVFRSGKFGNIAGCIVRKGVIKRGTKARLVRDGVVIAPDLEIKSLRREKDDVTEVREGFECGMTLGHKDIREEDIIETFEMREKARD